MKSAVFNSGKRVGRDRKWCIISQVGLYIGGGSYKKQRRGRGDVLGGGADENNTRKQTMFATVAYQ